MKTYFQKFKGTAPPPPRSGNAEVLWAVLGSAIALFLIGVLDKVCLKTAGVPLLMAPFGASAALVFGAPKSPLTQPRNVIGGHVVSALVGITVYKLTGGHEIAGICLAVSLAIGLMLLTGTLHPPGGATAFLAVAGGESIHSLGYWFVVSPCMTGSFLMVAVALVVLNIPSRQRYPFFW
ncbi:MAG: HPP family protein [Deltaproteobacteria bacterium]|nr:HPP family protein [Deltaproteobacteria bacterium]